MLLVDPGGNYCFLIVYFSISGSWLPRRQKEIFSMPFCLMSSIFDLRVAGDSYQIS